MRSLLPLLLGCLALAALIVILWPFLGGWAVLVSVIACLFGLAWTSVAINS